MTKRSRTASNVATSRLQRAARIALAEKQTTRSKDGESSSKAIKRARRMKVEATSSRIRRSKEACLANLDEDCSASSSAPAKHVALKIRTTVSALNSKKSSTSSQLPFKELIGQTQNRFRGLAVHSSTDSTEMKMKSQSVTAMQTLDPFEKLHWIKISNVHEAVAYRNIFRGLFGRIGNVKEVKIHIDAGNGFQGIVDVGFERNENAETAVATYSGNVQLCGLPWDIQMVGTRRCTRFYSSGSSSVYQPISEKSANQGSTDRADARATVKITNIHWAVPIDMIPILFEKAGLLKGYNVCDKRDQARASSTPVVASVVYEQREDAASAVARYLNNITFFGHTWKLKLQA